jgi:acetyltransferase-like isoleucine patch superfamily enzyme
MKWKVAVRRAAREPRLALKVATGLARGWYYRAKFRLLGRSLTVGRGFRVHGPLDIRGPGSVVFGDDCTVSSTRHKPTTPWTHAKDAVIRIGDGVVLSGTRIGCQDRVEVGDYAGIADAHILDTDFHEIAITDGPRYNTHSAPDPVVVERNAWIAAGSMIMKGVTVGENAVVGARAVVTRDVPAGTLVVGNPARVARRLADRRSRAHAG